MELVFKRYHSYVSCEEAVKALFAVGALPAGLDHAKQLMLQGQLNSREHGMEVVFFCPESQTTKVTPGTDGSKGISWTLCPVIDLRNEPSLEHLSVARIWHNVTCVGVRSPEVILEKIRLLSEQFGVRRRTCKNHLSGDDLRKLCEDLFSVQNMWRQLYKNAKLR